MTVSARAVLAAGVVAMTGAAVAVAPSMLPATMTTVEVVRPVSFAAGSTPPEPTAGDVKAALELIGQLSPVRPPGKVTVRPDAHRTAAAPVIDRVSRSVGAVDGVTDAPDDTTDGPADGVAGQAVEGPVALNAASDLINGIYSISRYWANYVSLELGPWLINWIPFGYLISDQIYIWYPDFVLPVVDSFVYHFLDPVVNDPLNLGVWLDGIGDIINTAITGVYNGIVSEIEYVLDFGWFPIPLPPLPGFPLPSAASDSAPTEAALSATAAHSVAETAGETGASGEGTSMDETGAGTTGTDPVGTDPEPVDDGSEPTVGDGSATVVGDGSGTVVDGSEPTVEDGDPLEEPTVEDTDPVDEPTVEDTDPVDEPTVEQDGQDGAPGEERVDQHPDPGTAPDQQKPAAEQDGDDAGGAPAPED